MKVAKWGNGLAVRLPAEMVDTLDLKPGDEIEIVTAKKLGFGFARALTREELVKSFRQFRWMLPADFRFDRDQAHER